MGGGVEPDVGGEIERVSAALRACWSRWTADPTEELPWSETNPSAGHCWVSAMILRDRVGGDLVEARVERADGSLAAWHYWNRLGDGTELDITREQFRAGERLVAARVVAVSDQLDSGPMVGPYRLLADQVRRWLAGEAPSGPLPASVRAVCRDGAGRLLVAQRADGDWELPGGRPEAGEHYAETLVRAVAEATGLALAVGRILGVEALETVAGWVAVVAFACELTGETAAGTTRVAFLGDRELAGLADVYRRLAAQA